MADVIEFNKTPDDRHLVLRSKELDLEAGWLGKAFGGAKNAPINIAGVVILLLVLAGLASMFFQSLLPSSEYWKIAVPLITLVMGFLFGRGSKGE